MTTFLQLVVVGFSTGSVFAVVGMSLVLIYRTTGIVNFAQGMFAVLGGLLTFRLHDGGLPLWAASVAAVLLSGVAASFLAVVAFGFRRRTTSLASLIITLGASFVAEALLLLWLGDIPRSYPGVSAHAWDLGGVLVQPQYVLIAGVALAAALGLTVVPAADDRRAGARRVLRLAPRRRARGAERPLDRGGRVRVRRRRSRPSRARCSRRATR